MSVVIFGAGGHGWINLSEFILNQKEEVKIYNLPVDSGGDTGFWHKLLKYNSKNSRPFGDLNKILIYFISQNYSPEISSLLNSRSQNIHEISVIFLDFANKTNLNKDLVSQFLEYLENFKDLISIYLKNNPQDYTLCLGYFWYDFCLNYKKNMPSWNELQKKYNFLPNNLTLDFSYENWMKLTGEDESNNQYFSEEEIDSSENKILPKSFKILNDKDEILKPTEVFLEDLKESSLVIIPNGSIANWLPMLNDTEIVEILKEKLLIWMINPTQKKNEYTADIYLKYLINLNLKPITIGKFDTQFLPEYHLISSDKENYDPAEIRKVIDIINSKK